MRNAPLTAVVARTVLPGLAVCLIAAAARADDWPQFRGPTGEGHSTERGLPLEWDEGHNILWKAPVAGSGWSSPVIAGRRVWVTTSIDTRDPATRSTIASLRAVAYDLDTGRQLVDTEVFRVARAGVINVKNSRASPTPIVEGDRVYVHFGADGTAALTTAGEVLWNARFPYESQHGNGGSPLLLGDLLIVSCDGADTAFVVALDKRTGEVRWKTPRRSPWDQAYSTPHVIHVEGRDQVVSVGAHRAAAYDPVSGDELWHVRYPDGFSNVPRPVFGHGLVYIATGFNEPSLLAVRMPGRGDITRSHLAWSLSRGAPLTPSPLLVGDLLFIVSDNGIATCLDAKTGVPYWRERLGGGFSASPVYADGRVYFLNEEGVTIVIAPDRTFRKLATNELDASTLSSMAVSAGSLFVRSDRHLYRIGTAAPAAAAQPARPQDLFERGVTDFFAGKVTESLVSFDALAKLAPDAAPQLWQRGIALYYAGRYADCRAQFESHRLVNPDDVENAAWHFLCVARAESPAAARAALLPVGPDPRVPMRQVYDLFRGVLTTKDVLAAGRSGPASEFFAQLYLGLYEEARGNAAAALDHITAAAADKYRSAGGYMHAVARVHLSILQRGK